MFKTDYLQDTLAAIDDQPLLAMERADYKMSWLAPGVIECIPHYRLNDTCVIISSGIHGNETAPMEICNQLVSDIYHNTLTISCPTLFIYGNPQAMRLEQRFVDENLNRLFSNKHQTPLIHNSIEAKRAKLLEQLVDQFVNQYQHGKCCHYDLHTAIRGAHFEKFAVYPYLHQREPDLEQLKFLHGCGIEAVLYANSPAGTFSYYTSHQYNAHSFTVELGQVRPFGHNELTKLSLLKKNLERLLTAKPVQLAHDLSQLRQFRVKAELIKTSDQFQLLIADDVKNFTAFPQGVPLTKDQDQQYITTQTERIIFPNPNVATGQRAGLMIVDVDPIQ